MYCIIVIICYFAFVIVLDCIFLYTVYFLTIAVCEDRFRNGLNLAVSRVSITPYSINHTIALLSRSADGKV